MFIKLIEKTMLIFPVPPLRIAFDQRPTDLSMCIYRQVPSQQKAPQVLGVRNKDNGRGETRKENRVKTVPGIMLNNMHLWNIYYIQKPV